MGDNPLFMMPPNSENKENILGYIGGYIVKKLQKIIDCNVCNNAMLSSNKYYFNLSLVTQKDRGGLVYPSTDIVKILSIAERVFKSFVIGADNRNPGISSSKHLRLKMTNIIMSELSDNLTCLQNYFIMTLIIIMIFQKISIQHRYRKLLLKNS